MSEKKAFLLRISQELWDELQRTASDEFRSVNGQIEVLLRDALRKRGRQVKPASEEAEDE